MFFSLYTSAEEAEKGVAKQGKGRKKREKNKTMENSGGQKRKPHESEHEEATQQTDGAEELQASMTKRDSKKVKQVTDSKAHSDTDLASVNGNDKTGPEHGGTIESQVLGKSKSHSHDDKKKRDKKKAKSKFGKGTGGYSGVAPGRLAAYQLV